MHSQTNQTANVLISNVLNRTPDESASIQTLIDHGLVFGYSLLLDHYCIVGVLEDHSIKVLPIPDTTRALTALTPDQLLMNTLKLFSMQGRNADSMLHWNSPDTAVRAKFQEALLTLGIYVEEFSYGKTLLPCTEPDVFEMMAASQANPRLASTLVTNTMHLDGKYDLIRVPYSRNSDPITEWMRFENTEYNVAIDANAVNHEQTCH
ncbi:MAG: hypothetical protein C9356_15810 [Oleiphilus sp.]|nr:MAG: hypothetical protein C9356_15810 [Oleiphilus sp.]